MRNAIRVALTITALVLAVHLPCPAQTPVTPESSPQARALLASLYEIRGKQIFSGQAEPSPGGDLLAPSSEQELERIQKIAEKTPAIRAFDLFQVTGARSPVKTNLPVTERALAWGRSNGIVAIQWHWLTPNRSGGWDYAVKSLEDQTNGWKGFDLDRAIVPGTPERDELLRGIDAAAAQLARLRDAGIPVLWRPFPECSGDWFWWGSKGPEPFKKLWKLTFDRMAVGHHLTNLIWVFNPVDVTAMESWYPGDEWVDVISLDRYAEQGEFPSFKSDYDALQSFCHGRKVLALSENGAIPAPDLLVRDQASWAYFCTWSGKFILDGKVNPTNHINSVYNHPYVKNHP